MKKQFAVTHQVLLCVVFVLTMAGQSFASGMDADPDFHIDETDVFLDQVEVELEQIEETDAVIEETVSESEIEGEAAATSSIVPIQGRLTNASGSPLNGSYTVHARLYDSASGGAMLCQDDDLVNVKNGLFNMEMHHCTASVIDGEQLYLGIQVGTDPEMTPRQRISAVPYAWTVKPGAIIKGATTYLFVPATTFKKAQTADPIIWTSTGASVNFYADTAAIFTRSIRLPITIPGSLYGQGVRVTQIRVYYDCQNGANNYIADTQLYKMTSATSYVSLINDNTDRTSNSGTSYVLSTDASVNTLSENEGFLTLRLGLRFSNVSDWITIAGVRVTLVTNY